MSSVIIDEKYIIYIDNNNYLSLNNCISEGNQIICLEMNFNGNYNILKMINEQSICHNLYLMFENNTSLHIYKKYDETHFIFKNNLIVIENIISEDLIKNYISSKNDNIIIIKFCSICRRYNSWSRCECPSTNLHYKKCCYYNPIYQYKFLEENYKPVTIFSKYLKK